MILIKWTSITKTFIAILAVSGAYALISGAGFMSWLQIATLIFVCYIVLSLAFSAVIKKRTVSGETEVASQDIQDNPDATHDVKE